MFCITPSRRRICKPLIKIIFKHVHTKCHNKRLELYALTSFHLSGEISFWESLISLDFDQIFEEMNSKTPTLLTLLKNCLKTKTPRSNGKIMLAMTAGIIFKHRRSSCSLLQRVISLVLYAGHSAKQVHNFLIALGTNILLLWIKFKNVATRIVFTDCLQQ